jgi:RimJ/RimL family protein N-acetyltransferase
MRINDLQKSILETEKQAVFFIKHKNHLFESWIENNHTCFRNGRNKDELTENFFLFLASTKNHFRHYIIHNNDIVLTSCVIKHHHIYNDYEIHEVCTNTKYHNQGLCKILITSVLDYLKTQNANSVSIYCLKDNLSACKCYQDVFGKPIYNTKETKAFRKQFN